MELKTINIKGKSYVTVNERIKAFRSIPEFKDWSLITEIIDLSNNGCTMKASILNKDGKVISTGFARETVEKSSINKFAFVENCETSAWGRALGNLGIGVDTAICSAEELLQKMSYDDAEDDSYKKELANEKRKATIEKKKSAEEYLHTPEGARMKFESVCAYLKKIQVIDVSNQVVMDNLNKVIDLMVEQNLQDEYNKLKDLIDSKMPKDDGDKIVY